MVPRAGCALALVVARLKQAWGGLCALLCDPVAGQSGPQTQNHLRVWVVFSARELTAQREKQS